MRTIKKIKSKIWWKKSIGSTEQCLHGILSFRRWSSL